jgi:hypothetical protein
MTASERDEIARLVNSVHVARDMERKQLAGEDMSADYTKSIGKARLEVWKSGDTWSAQVFDGAELVAENLRAFTNPGEAMDWADDAALALVTP